MPGTLYVVSINDIRTTTSLPYITSPSISDIFYINDSGYQGEFYYDSAAPGGTTDDTGLVLINTSTGHVFRRIIYDHIDVKWFGATGDGSTDDITAIQATVDACIAHRIGKVYFPVGNYVISKGIVVRITGGLLEGFVLEGQTATYGGQVRQAAVLVNNADSFGLALDHVKGARVRNLTFLGQNTALTSLTPHQVLEDMTTNWFNGVRSNSLSPHAAIVIDPFDSTTSSGDRYPGFSSYYNTSSGGSTDVVIEGCTVRFFAVGYCISPRGTAQNGEAIMIRDCWANYNYAAVSTGEHQNRSVYVENFKCWDNTYSVFDTRTFGSATGTPPEVNGLNIAGYVRYLCILNNWAGSKGLIVKNMHAESMASLGGNFSDQAGELIIEDSWVSFAGGLDTISPSVHRPVTVFNGATLRVINSTFWQYDDPHAVPLQVAVGTGVFEKCTLSYLPYTSHSVYPQLTFRDCVGAGSATTFGDNQLIVNGKAPEYQSSTILFTSGMQWQTSLGSFKRVKVEDTTNILSKDVHYVSFANPITLTSVTDSILQAVFNLSNTSDDFLKLMGGDILVSSMTDEFGNTRFGVFGKVDSLNTGTGDVTLKSISAGLTASTSYTVLLYRNQYLLPSLILGDLTSGSSVMSNVLLELNSSVIQPNIPVYSPYFPDGTYIVSYNSGAGTITLSNKANTTISHVELLSSNWQGIMWGAPFTASPNHFGYKAGDIIYNTNIATYPNVSHWICIQSGITATAQEPQFQPYFKKTASSTYTANQTAALSDYGKVIFLNSGSGAVTYSISPSLFASLTLQIFAIKPGANVVTITPSSGTINGAASYSMSNNESIKVYSDGTNLFIL